jgi:hypothetical protein
VLTGCAQTNGGEAAASASPSAVARATGASPRTAAPGEVLGAAGSPCELPVTFAVAAGWEAEAVDAPAAQPSGGPAGEPGDALLRQGPVTLVCEIDAKPAGNIGFLRVWTGRPGDADARGVLQAFVAAQDGAGRAAYRAFTTGGLIGVQVDYLYRSELLDETKKETALAVTTAQGPVVLHLGGMDDEEHEAMLPAFELAKRTLRAA